jgi:hypothetical protein
LHIDDPDPGGSVPSSEPYFNGRRGCRFNSAFGPLHPAETAPVAWYERTVKTASDFSDPGSDPSSVIFPQPGMHSSFSDAVPSGRRQGFFSPRSRPAADPAALEPEADSGLPLKNFPAAPLGFGMIRIHGVLGGFCFNPDYSNDCS